MTVLERGPLSVLQRIAGITERAIFMLHDFHRFFDPAYPASAVIVRMLRDLTQPLRQRGQGIIIISPVFPTLPGELEREVELIDFGLPQRPEVQGVLEGLADAYRGTSAVDVELPPPKEEALVRAALGLTLDEAEQAFGRSLVHARTFDATLVAAQKQQTIRRTQAVEYIPARVDISNVGGLDLLKQWLLERKESYSEDAARSGVVAPRGILLLGVPGSGKSLVAKAVASIWDYPLVRLDAGSLFGSYLGQSEANMRRALSTAEAVAPCVLWVDEVEKAFGGVMGGQDAGAGRRLFGYFLTWLQENRAPVFVIATANSVQDLPPEFLRQGRFDAIFFLDLPSAEERKAIWRIQIAARRTDEQEAQSLLNPDDYDINSLAAATDGFSGAEIEQVVLAAIQRAYNDGRRKPTTDDFTAATQATVPLSKTRSEEIEFLRNWAKSRARPASSQQPNLEEFGVPRRAFEIPK
jgi:SpoVK/Ycf46/Vps4 family AAA+-type ATPase